MAEFCEVERCNFIVSNDISRLLFIYSFIYFNCKVIQLLAQGQFEEGNTSFKGESFAAIFFVFV